MKNKQFFIKIFIVLILLFFLIFSFQNFIYQNNQFNSHRTLEHLKDVGKQTANMYYKQFENYKNQIFNVSQLLSRYDYSHEEIGNILNNLEGEKTIFKRLWYINKDKKSYNYKNEEMIITNGTYVKNIFQGETGISDVFSSAYNGKDVIAIYSPVYKKDIIVGGVVGIIEMNDVDTDFVYDIFDNQAYIFATTINGQIITKVENSNTLYFGSNYFDFLKNDVQFSEGSYQEVLNRMKQQKTGYIQYSYKNNNRIVYYSPVFINNWYIFTIISDNVVLAQNSQFNIITFTLLTSIIFVLGILFFLVVQYFTKTNRKTELMNDQLIENNQKIETILKLVSDRIFEYDIETDTLILDAWDNYPKVMFNHFLSHLHNYEFVSLEHEELLREKFELIINGQKEVSFDAKFPYISKDDETWFHISMIHIQHQKAIGALKNSTKQMNEYNLLLQDQMFKNSVYSHALYMFAVHLKTKKVIISQFKGQYQSYIDYDYEKDFMRDFLEKTYEKDRHYVKQFFDYQRIQNLFLSSIQNDKIEFRFQYNHDYQWVRFRVQFERQSDNNEVLMIAYCNDINEEKSKQIENEYKAQRDGLTGLLNRETFDHHVQRYLNQQHYLYQYSAYIILDLDNFKTINDQLGHLEGNKVLIEVAKTIETIFNKNSIAGRFGGDEFMIFIYNQVSFSIIEDKINQLLIHVRDIKVENDYRVSCSVGVCLVNGEKTSQELFEKSDKALYECKNEGKDGFKIYSK